MTNPNWKPAADGSINFSDAIDDHGRIHRERTATELLARLSVLRRHEPEHAIVATDLERLAVAQLARTDLEDRERTFWDSALKTAPGSAEPLPEPPAGDEGTRSYFAQPRHFDLLAGDERIELSEQAKNVTPRQAEEALSLLEMQEMSGDSSLDFGLSDEERAAALMLRDDRRFRDAIETVQADLDDDRRKRA